MVYRASTELVIDTHDLGTLSHRLRNVARDKDKSANLVNSVSPKWILYAHGAPIGLLVLMGHTPVGEDNTNWGFWDYKTHVLYGGEHSKGTLRRGWITVNPSDAEFDLTITPNYKTAWQFIRRNVKVRKCSGIRYQVILENCVPYGPYVEYGHHVVMPHTKTEYDKKGFPVDHGERHRTGRPVNRVYKGTGSNRWVPGKFFVAKATSKENWQPVTDVMYKAYVERMKKLLR